MLTPHEMLIGGDTWRKCEGEAVRHAPRCVAHLNHVTFGWEVQTQFTTTRSVAAMRCEITAEVAHTAVRSLMTRSFPETQQVSTVTKKTAIRAVHKFRTREYSNR